MHSFLFIKTKSIFKFTYRCKLLYTLNFGLRICILMHDFSLKSTGNDDWGNWLGNDWENDWDNDLENDWENDDWENGSMGSFMAGEMARPE